MLLPVFFFFFFFLMIRRPPRSTLFPYRRSSDLLPFSSPECERSSRSCAGHGPRRPGHRSEEHTSELQSLRHLVCRLLLAKKKKTRATAIRRTTRKPDNTENHTCCCSTYYQ